MRDFVTAVKSELDSRQKSVKWLAEQAGLVPRTVQSWVDRGVRPNVHDAVKVCKVLNRTVEDMVGESTARAKSALRRELDHLLDQLTDSDLGPVLAVAQHQAFERVRSSQSTSG